MPRLTQIVGTACSGTGAPSHALNQIIPDGFAEEISSEKHAAWLWRDWSDDDTETQSSCEFLEMFVSGESCCWFLKGPTRQWFLSNHEPLHCWKDMVFARSLGGILVAQISS